MVYALRDIFESICGINQKNSVLVQIEIHSIVSILMKVRSCNLRCPYRRYSSAKETSATAGFNSTRKSALRDPNCLRCGEIEVDHLLFLTNRRSLRRYLFTWNYGFLSRVIHLRAQWRLSCDGGVTYHRGCSFSFVWVQGVNFQADVLFRCTSRPCGSSPLSPNSTASQLSLLTDGMKDGYPVSVLGGNGYVTGVLAALSESKYLSFIDGGFAREKTEEGPRLVVRLPQRAQYAPEVALE